MSAALERLGTYGVPVIMVYIMVFHRDWLEGMESFLIVGPLAYLLNHLLVKRINDRWDRDATEARRRDED